MRRPERQQRWPWDTLWFDQSEIAALRAVREGSADEYQQRSAYSIIIEKVCALRRISFTAGGLDGQRGTDFFEGRRWVGGMIERAAAQPLTIDIHGEPPPMPMSTEPSAPPPEEVPPLDEPEGFAVVLINPFDEVQEVNTQ